MSKMKEYELTPSTIETIDRSLFTWLNEEMNIHSTTNKGWKKVPVLWQSAERAYHIKNDKDLRDSTGALKLPLISVERASITKSLTDKGGHYAALPENVNYSTSDLTSIKGGVRQINRRIEQRKTANIANEGIATIDSTTERTLNSKTVYESILIPLPVYINVVYNIVVRADYQQQINEIISTFVTKPNSSGINSVVLRADGHWYEAFIDGSHAVSSTAKDMGESELTYEAKINIKVLGYILGSDKNDDKPKIAVKENVVDIKISRERTAVGDINPYLDTDEDYREF